MAPLNTVQIDYEIRDGEQFTLKWVFGNWKELFESNMQRAKYELPFKTLNGRWYGGEVLLRFFLEEYIHPNPNGQGYQRWCSLWMSTPSDLDTVLNLEVYVLPENHVVYERQNVFEEDAIPVSFIPTKKSAEIKRNCLHVANCGDENKNWEAVEDAPTGEFTIYMIVKRG